MEMDGLGREITKLKTYFPKRDFQKLVPKFLEIKRNRTQERLVDKMAFVSLMFLAGCVILAFGLVMKGW